MIWSYSVHFGPTCSICFYSFHFDSIRSTLVLFSFIRSILVLFSPFRLLRSYSVQFGLIRFIWYYSVHCGTIWSIHSTLVLFGTFSLPWSYSVHFFFFFGITPIRYIESEWVSHFMRKTSTELPSDYHPNSKQVPSNFKSQLKMEPLLLFKNGMIPSVLSFLVHVISILWTLFLSAFLIQIPYSIFYGIKIPKRAQQTWPSSFFKNTQFLLSFHRCYSPMNFL